MGKGLLTMIGLGGPPEDAEEEATEATDSLKDRKVTAAEEALQALKDEDAEGFADAVTAIVRTCRLERMKGRKSEPEEE